MASASTGRANVVASCSSVDVANPAAAWLVSMPARRSTEAELPTIARRLGTLLLVLCISIPVFVVALVADELGLKVAGPTGPEVLTFESGTSKILVYKSQFAGTNQATAVTWVVGEEIDAIVRDLQAKGVAFEKYDFPGVTHEGDVHVFGPMRNAWFKDPDGNMVEFLGPSASAGERRARAGRAPRGTS